MGRKSHLLSHVLSDGPDLIQDARDCPPHEFGFSPHEFGLLGFGISY